MNKRDRSEHVERDANELQQRRLNSRPHVARGTNWQRLRRSPDFTESFTGGSGSSSGGLLQSMEFDIQTDMVGAVIGKGGTTARAIRSRTGANVHVHSPGTDSLRTYVELRGRREQIEAAFEELRAVVSSVDEEFSEQMQASVTLKTKPETVGCLIGKQGQNIKQIEEETRARVRVEGKKISPSEYHVIAFHAAHEEGEEFQCVHVSGEVAAVELATRLVQESLERYDATRIKKQYPIPMTSHRVQQQQQQQQKALETKPMVTIEPMQKMENDPAIPPILIQAPAGGFAPHPAVLVLQPDGTYHPAQIVTAYDGGVNSPGLVTVVAQPGLASMAAAATATTGTGMLASQSQPSVDIIGQQRATLATNTSTTAAANYSAAMLAAGAVPQGNPQAIYQHPAAAAAVAAGGLIPQLAPTLPITQGQVTPSLTLTTGTNQHQVITADSFLHHQLPQQQQPQIHQQPQPMHLYDFATAAAVRGGGVGISSQAFPELNSMSTFSTVGIDPMTATATTLRQAIPSSMPIINSNNNSANNSNPLPQQSSNLPSAT